MEGSRASGETLDTLRRMVGELKVAMLTTLDDDGTLRSRPLQTLQMDGNNALWFFTSVSSAKVHEAAGSDWQVNLSYANPDTQGYVSISGTGTLVRDRGQMRLLWTEWAKLWFPKGVDDPDLALLCVTPQKAEYWDAPGSTLGQLYAFTKAAVTGEKDALGENAKLTL